MARADQAGNAINSAGGDWKSRVKAMRNTSPDAAPAGEALHVPGFITLSDLDRGNRLFFGVGRAVRRLLGIVAIVALVVFVALVLIQVQYHSEGSGVRGDPRVTHWAVRVDSDALNALLISFLAFVAWLGFVTFRRKTARIGVLRTSRVRSVSGITRKTMRAEMRAYGHLIGLTERNGQGVRSGSGLATLAHRFQRRTPLNLRVPFARAEILSVAPSETWRPLTMNLLLDSADAIVVDLSDPEDSVWKLDAAHERAKRCVFIALWGRSDAAEAALQAAGITNPLHPYAPDGHMVDRAKFRAAMLGAMRTSLS